MSKTNAKMSAQTPQVPRWLVQSAYIFVFLAAVVLLFIHTAGVGGTTVDTTSLGLLALVLLVPLAPYIRRLSAGGVVAEIGSNEAQQLRASAADLPTPPEEPSAWSIQAPTVRELIDRDPPLGLAQLRIELEKEVRRLYVTHNPDADGGKHSLGVMARELREQGSLPREIADPMADVVALANRAIHGEFVPTDVATEIAEVGMRVLAAVRELN